MKTAITIGRSSSCDIILPDTNMKISREHARISISGGRYVFENLGRHGSYMNGCMMGNERVVIAPGTPILLANMEPLPWNEIYRLLPLKGVVVERPAERETYAPQIPGSLHVNVQENGLYQPVVEEKKSNGMGITGFVLSLVAIVVLVLCVSLSRNIPASSCQTRSAFSPMRPVRQCVICRCAGRRL